MNCLPSGWTTARIVELCDVIKEKGNEGSVPYLEIGNIDISNKKYCFSEKPAVKGCKKAIMDDILVSRVRPTRGAVTFVNEEHLNVSSAFTILRNKTRNCNKYLWFFLAWNHEYLKHLGDNCTGTMYPTTSDSVVTNYEVPIAPINEQRRIIAKLESIRDKESECQKRLEKIAAIMKRFRQSVFAAACSGRLTEDWRLQRNGIEENEKVIINDIADYIGGFAYKSKTFIEEGNNQVIRIGNVKPFYLNNDVAPIYIPDSIARDTDRFKLKRDDIVISMTGTRYKKDYGFAALVRNTEHNLYLNQRVSRLRCNNKILPKYLLFWFQTNIFRDQFFSGETGNVNQGNVGADGIRNSIIDIPTILEQQEIILRVERLLKLEEQLELRFQNAICHTNNLWQSIIGKAFRGELVL